MRHFFTLILLFALFPGYAQIRVNQIGYLPDESKIALVPENISGSTFEIIDHAGQSVYTGSLNDAAYWEFSDDEVKIADFTVFSEVGEFQIQVGGDTSYKFEIGNHVYQDVFKASVKAFYFNRASTELKPEHAGIFARAAGHPDTLIYYYPSGDVAPSSPKGWYDAGDYNKYIVNSGISTYTLMALYEHYPEYISTVDLNIPESGNSTPDVLDEAFWNLSWMLTMQAENGNVYHKLTNADFDGYIMPDSATEPRYMVGLSAPATRQFAATMAVASRIFANFQEDYPGYDEIFLDAALKAYNSTLYNSTSFWDQYFRNPSGISTGTYGNCEGAQEWTETELFITTNGEYGTSDFDSQRYPHWTRVGSLSLVSLAANMDRLDSDVQGLVRDEFISLGDEMFDEYAGSPYQVAMGTYDDDYVWGSNGNVANQSLMLLIAYELTDEKKYLDAALGNIDYLFGKNPTGYSYVTGHGDKTPMFPHHRPTVADSIVAPVPGWLVGGPAQTNPDCDGYVGEAPATIYVDKTCSYSTNEVAINWNAPFAYIMGAVNALEYEKDVVTGTRGKVKNNLKVYPVPANDLLHIEIIRDYPVAIFGISGNKILERNLQSGTLDISELPGGIYILKVKTDANSLNAVFVKK